MSKELLQTLDSQDAIKNNYSVEDFYKATKSFGSIERKKVYTTIVDDKNNNYKQLKTSIHDTIYSALFQKVIDKKPLTSEDRELLKFSSLFTHDVPDFSQVIDGSDNYHVDEILLAGFESLYKQEYAHMVTLLEESGTATSWLSHTIGRLNLVTATSSEAHIAVLSAQQKSQLQKLITIQSYIAGHTHEVQGKMQLTVEYQKKQYIDVYNSLPAGDQKRKALIELISIFGESIKKTLSGDVKKALQSSTLSEVYKTMLDGKRLEKTQIIAQNQRTIDIAQQVLSSGKVVFTQPSAEYLAHKIKYDMKATSETTVQGNTQILDYSSRLAGISESTNFRKLTVGIDGKPLVIEGSRQKSSEHVKVNAYDAIKDSYKIMDLPGYGKILVNISPALFAKIQYTTLPVGSKIMYMPQYNSRTGAYELTEKTIAIARLDSKGVIGYKTLDSKKDLYIQPSTYKELLQLKSIQTTSLLQTPELTHASTQMQDFQLFAKPFTDMMGQYVTNPGEQGLSSFIATQIQKPGGVKDRLKTLEKTMETTEKQLKDLQKKLRDNIHGVMDEQEKQIADAIKNIDLLQVSIKKLSALVNYSSWESADKRAIHDTLKTIVVIVGAVAAVVLTGGMALGFVGAAAFGTLGGMVAARGYDESRRRVNKNLIESGRNTLLGLENDLGSDVGNFVRDAKDLMKNGKIEGWIAMMKSDKADELMSSLTQEFALGTLQTAVFMGVGRLAGGYLSKLAMAQSGSTTTAGRFICGLYKNISRLQSSDIQLLEKRGFNSFIKACAKETSQELVQEGAETGANKIDGTLGMIVSIITSMSVGSTYKAGAVDLSFVSRTRQGDATHSIFGYEGNLTDAKAKLALTAQQAGYSYETATIFDPHIGNRETHRLIKTDTHGKKDIIELVPLQGSYHMVENKSQLDKYGCAFVSNIDDHTAIYEYDSHVVAIRGKNGAIVGKNYLLTNLTRLGYTVPKSINSDGSFVVRDERGREVRFVKKGQVEKEKSLLGPSLINTESGQNIESQRGMTSNIEDASVYHELKTFPSSYTIISHESIYFDENANQIHDQAETLLQDIDTGEQLKHIYDGIKEIIPPEQQQIMEHYFKQCEVIENIIRSVGDYKMLASGRVALPDCEFTYYLAKGHVLENAIIADHTSGLSSIEIQKKYIEKAQELSRMFLMEKILVRLYDVTQKITPTQIAKVHTMIATHLNSQAEKQNIVSQKKSSDNLASSNEHYIDAYLNDIADSLRNASSDDIEVIVMNQLSANITKNTLEDFIAQHHFEKTRAQEIVAAWNQLFPDELVQIARDEVSIVDDASHGSDASRGVDIVSAQVSYATHDIAQMEEILQQEAHNTKEFDDAIHDAEQAGSRELVENIVAAEVDETLHEVEMLEHNIQEEVAEAIKQPSAIKKVAVSFIKLLKRITHLDHVLHDKHHLHHAFHDFKHAQGVYEKSAAICDMTASVFSIVNTLGRHLGPALYGIVAHHGDLSHLMGMNLNTAIFSGEKFVIESVRQFGRNIDIYGKMKSKYEALIQHYASVENALLYADNQRQRESIVMSSIVDKIQGLLAYSGMSDLQYVYDLQHRLIHEPSPAVLQEYKMFLDALNPQRGRIYNTLFILKNTLSMTATEEQYHYSDIDEEMHEALMPH